MIYTPTSSQNMQDIWFSYHKIWIINRVGKNWKRQFFQIPFSDLIFLERKKKGISLDPRRYLVSKGYCVSFQGKDWKSIPRL